MDFIRQIYAKLRAAWPPNRFLVAITPLITLISGSVSGAAATWLAVHFPGIPPLDPGWLAGIFIAMGTSSALSFFLLARKWLDGHIKYEAMLASPDLEPLAVIPRVTPLDSDAQLSLPSDIDESDNSEAPPA